MSRFSLKNVRAVKAAGGAWLAAGSLLIFCASWLCASADEFEQHHAHEHGKVTLNVAIDGSTLLVELDAPAINVVGFEHAPRTKSEHTAAQQAAHFIETGHGLLGFPPAAECHFLHTEFTEPHWEAPEAEAAEATGAHNGSEEHADYEARFTYQCGHPAALAWLEPWLLAKLLNLTEARINLATPAGQRSESVTAPRARVQLQ
jgi:RES domain-containing protein